ncbi:uncharacterized protein LOC143041462 [Oratosquilla oratoria]|uniref:uncharacterized protein LOC143041462 n=1 Tax=Oratosquilla oratoria TaxID=337810 RepID=UPI003F776F56
MREVLRMTGAAGISDMMARNGFLDLEAHPEVHDVFRAGRCIEDDYEVEKDPIARGKFAWVRRAWHRATGQVFAAKYIKRRRGNVSLECEARHEAAVLLLGRRDSNIVTIHEVYETRAEYIILLEYAPGGDLQRLLDEAMSLEEVVVRGILRSILRGLRFMHQHAIAHLDIKPQNVVLMSEEADPVGVKLCDFGISRVLTKNTELTQIMGTPDYVAPEVINFEPICLGTDMWAVGVLVYVLLTGCTPFGGSTDQETFVNITQGDYDFPEELFDHISQEAKDFISVLLVKKPSERMSVNDCLDHPWMTCVLPTSSSSHAVPATGEYPNGTYGQHDIFTDNYSSNDSAYSSDSNGSQTYVDPTAYVEEGTPFPDEGHPFTDTRSTYGSGLSVPPLCRCPIPEEQSQVLQQDDQLGHSRNQRRKGRRVSMDMEEALRAVHHQQQHQQQQRATRRSSLMLDDPRYLYDPARPLEPIRPLEVPSISNNVAQEEPALPQDSDVDSGVSCQDCEETRIEVPNLYRSDSYEGGDAVDAASLLSWDDYAEMQGRRTPHNQFDPNTLTEVAKPWEKLCNGSVSRAITQLTVKSVPPKKSETRSPKSPKSEPRSCCKSELRASRQDLRASKSDLRASKSDLRASKSDLRASKSDLRASKSDLRASKAELRASKSDLRASKSDLRASKSDLRASKSDLRASKSDLRASRADLRGSRTDLCGSRNELNLSRLDLTRESLDSASYNMNNNNINNNTTNNNGINDLDLDHESRDVIRGDFTLPRRGRFDRPGLSQLIRGNSIHMSFRMPKRRDMAL